MNNVYLVTSYKRERWMEGQSDEKKEGRGTKD